ncbi:MAG: hypothetical protein ACI8T1_000392 [Verrucomicrobiales bacterium]|jgi:hypothetical protein
MVLPSLAKQFAHSDPQAGLAWADSLAEGEERSLYLGKLLGHWSTLDLPAAVEVIQRLDNPNIAQHALEQMAPEYAKVNPREAAEWASSQNDEALGGVMKQWAKSDPDEATAWLEAQGAAIDQNAAAAALSKGLYGADPGGAADWALSISEPALADERLNSIATKWLAQDSKALQSWLNQQSSDVHSHILELNKHLTPFVTKP